MPPTHFRSTRRAAILCMVLAALYALIGLPLMAVITLESLHWGIDGDVVVFAALVVFVVVGPAVGYALVAVAMWNARDWAPPALAILGFFSLIIILVVATLTAAVALFAWPVLAVAGFLLAWSLRLGARAASEMDDALPVRGFAPILKHPRPAAPLPPPNDVAPAPLPPSSPSERE